MPGQLPQVGSLQQFSAGVRTAGGLNLFHSPPQGSPASSKGQPVQQQPLEGSPSSAGLVSLAVLRSALLPHQLSLERSALASLAQYGSANASPCLTPLAPSPTVQSPVAGRTFHYSVPSSAAGSRSSLLMPQPSFPPQTHTGRETTGRFSEDLRLLSCSRTSLPEEVAQALGHPLPRSSIQLDTGYYPSPFSSPTLVPKPRSPIPGHITPPFQVSPGPPHQTLAPPSSSSSGPGQPPSRRGSELEPPQTVRAKLPSNL